MVKFIMLTLFLSITITYRLSAQEPANKNIETTEQEAEPVDSLENDNQASIKKISIDEYLLNLKSELDLSEDQVAKIKPLLIEQQKTIKTINNYSVTDLEWETLRRDLKKISKKIDNNLSEEQKKLLKDKNKQKISNKNLERINNSNIQ